MAKNLVGRVKGVGRTALAASAIALGSLFYSSCDSPITIENQKPVIEKVSAEPMQAYRGQDVTFSAQGYDPDGTITSYRWDFDNDGWSDATTESATTTYAYPEAGEYRASVTVTDNEGAKTTASLEDAVRVEEPEQIAYLNVNLSNGDKNVYLADLVDRGLDNERVLVKDASEPAWSPDGEYLAVVDTRRGISATSTRVEEVYLVDSEGKNQEPLLDELIGERFNMFNPEWSPDGTKIAMAYIDFKNGVSGIAVVDRNGKNFRRVYETRGAGTRTPTWCSEDEIVFSQWKPSWDDADLYRVKVDGSNPRNVTNTLWGEWDPSCSLDGSMTFVSNEGGQADIYFARNGNLEDLQRVTNDGGIEVDPEISPDGSSILFAKSQLYTVSLREGNSVQLTFEGLNRFPAWRPRPQE